MKVRMEPEEFKKQSRKPGHSQEFEINESPWRERGFKNACDVLHLEFSYVIQTSLGIMISVWLECYQIQRGSQCRKEGTG